MFDSFKSSCVQTRAVPPSAVFESGDWAKASAAQVSQVFKGFGDSHSPGAAWVEAKDKLLLVSALTNFPAGSTQTLVHLCMVTAERADVTELRALMASMTAVPPAAASDSNHISYVYVDQGEHVAVAHSNDNNVILPLIKTGQVRFAFLTTDSNRAILGFAVPATEITSVFPQTSPN